MRGILKETYLEMIDRKTVYMLVAVTVITILITLASGTLESSLSVNMGDDIDVKELDKVLGNPLLRAFSSFQSFLIFLNILATAGIFPNMFIKGRADYFLSKPMTRTSLVVRKLFSIFIIYGTLIMTCSIVVYLVMFLVHDIFQTGIIYLMLLNMISLFIWLTITTFGGIVLGSTGMAMMSAFIIWVVQLLLSYHESIKMLINSDVFNNIIKGLYYIFPKTGEISDLTVSIAIGVKVPSLMPLYTSIIFSFMLLFVTIYIFKRKNY